MKIKWITWIVFFCLVWPVAEAYDFEKPASGGTYLSTDKGVKAVDRFPVPAGQTLDASAEQLAEKSAMVAPLTETFALHSNPSATKVIYLDFDGHYGLEGGGISYSPYNFEGPDSTFSDAELTRIQLAWQSVSEDYLPFDVDVTTEDPGVEALRNAGSGDTHWGIRVVVSPSNWDYSWAYVGSFNWDTDYECQAYTGDNSWIWIADSASHEVGHSLWLGHDGGGGDGEYYEGHGSGATYWAPIMGWTKMTVPYGVSQWSLGEYSGANNTEDDLDIITTQNGFGYRTDDHGSTPATATAITIKSTGLVLVEEGIIERTTDLDYFSFTLSETGSIQLAIKPDSIAANLDISARLHDAGGAVLYSSNPPDDLNANFDLSLTTGDYYLSIGGSGLDDPLGPPADGYSDYGSLGYYSIEAMGGIATDIELSSGASTAPALRFSRRPANPFASSTSFSFTLPEARRVQARVYNVSGRLVETLLDRWLSAGLHTISWEPDTRNAPGAGLYLIRIEAGGEQLIARMMHLP